MRAFTSLAQGTFTLAPFDAELLDADLTLAICPEPGSQAPELSRAELREAAATIKNSGLDDKALQPK